MEKFKQSLQFLKTEKKWRWYAGVGVFALLLAWLNSSPSLSNEVKESPTSVDTYIPPGFQLVPIEVANYEALDSVLGQYGVVDLYSVAETGSESKAVARSVKILRAPLNPSQFAVLIEDDYAPTVVKQGPVYKVVIRNPKAHGTKIEKSKSRVTKIFHDDAEE